MLDRIIEGFREKSVVLLGFGREGEASYTLLRKHFPGKVLCIADARDDVRSNPHLAEDKNITFLTGEGYLSELHRFDLIIRSPGIPLWNVQPPVPREKITSQTDIFLQAYGHQVIGVTGTKGKSTTASLIHAILKHAGEDALLVGNIGNPAFHFVHLIKPETKIVFELSSHQLEYIHRAPHIAVLLNLFQEHLDAYAGYTDYQLAKVNIMKYQQKEDFLVYNADDELVAGHVKSHVDGVLYPFSLTREVRPGGFRLGREIVFSDGASDVPVWRIHQDRFLRGEHNLKNILAAINVSMLLRISTEAMEEAIGSFKGLEHRLEYVGEFHGIHFYNDSIATIPEACIEAIRAIPRVDTLVAGGFDRGIDYSGLAAYLFGARVRNLILIGAAGKRIGLLLEELGKHDKKIFYINRFDFFREIALRETRRGEVCLLSPAAASYDEFKNFEERGKRFRELVTI